MRIAIDLQACQSAPWGKVNRSCLAMAQAIARNAGGHDVWIVLNDQLPDAIEWIRHAFSQWLPRTHICVLALPLPTSQGVSSTWRRQAAQQVYRYGIAELQPDVLYIADPFGSVEDRTASLLAPVWGQTLLSTTLHRMPAAVPGEQQIRTSSAVIANTQEQCDALSNIDLLLTTSSPLRASAGKLLRRPIDQIIDLSGRGEASTNNIPAPGNRERKIAEDMSVDSEEHLGIFATPMPRETARMDRLREPLIGMAGWDAFARRAIVEFEHALMRKRAAIETDSHTQSASAELRYAALLANLAAIDHPTTDLDRRTVAVAISENRRRPEKCRLYVDVSVLCKIDIKSGIQRVTRAIVSQLLLAPPPGYEVRPVKVDSEVLGYRYANAYRRSLSAADTIDADDDWIDTAPGDIFLGLDFVGDAVPHSEAWFVAQRRRGLRIYFVVYDLLPLLRPEWFPAITLQFFPLWLRTIARVSDGLIGISRAVTDDLASWLQSNMTERRGDLKLGYFHLGADIESSTPSTGIPDDASSVLAALRSRPTILMVGTIEPRKGHLQALAAFEELWKRGIDVNLALVGKVGWMLNGFDGQLRRHPERLKRMFWLEGISDEYLSKVYQASSALLIASEGEGFGLPLIEAAQKGLPIIARDLAVFFEIAGSHAFYFSGSTPIALADVVETWLKQNATGAAPSSNALPWLSWVESKDRLLDIILNDRWYRDWTSDAEEYGQRDILISEVRQSEENRHG